MRVATPPPRLRDPVQAARLREHLARTGFTDAGVLELVGARRPGELGELPRERLEARTVGGSPLETLVRLFLMGTTVPRAAAERAFAPLPLALLADARLVAVLGDECRAPVQLLPYRSLWLAFDRPEEARERLAADYVMGVGSSTRTLESLVLRRPGATVLDLGAGCGTLGLLAASEAKRVVLADRSRRAAAFAVFNAALNGLARCTCVVGDRLGAFADASFDLLVSNPPFVISPSSRFVFRDGGLRGDRLVESIVREVPRVLREGGYAEILCNWAHYRSEPWQERLAGWCTSGGCDAWLVQSETSDPETYASTWVRHTEGDDPARLERTRAEWLAYYEREGIEAFSAGFLVLRRRSGGANWFRTDAAPARMLGPCGEDVVRVIETETFLRQAPDVELLATALRASASLRLEETSRPVRAGEGWEVVAVRAGRDQGLAWEAGLDASVAELLRRCDGRRPLGEIVRALWPTTAPSEAHGAIRERVLAIARDLLRKGFLELPATNAAPGSTNPSEHNDSRE